MADVVIWNGTPFSVYAQGRAGLHRRRAACSTATTATRQPVSDFMLGQGAAAREVC